jgi:hypothetical protein
MNEQLAKECEGDDQDVGAMDEGDEAANAMDNLRMEEDGEEEEDAQEERGAMAAAAAKPKKKKRKKKKKKAGATS